MTDQRGHDVSEREALEVAEASRETEWTRPSFLRELFLGNFRFDLIDPFPLEEPRRPELETFYQAFVELLRRHGDPVTLDTTGEYPEALIEALRELGAFGMKIPREYGGLGFSQAEYQQIMELLGSWDGNISALLSAHQSIGVPQPVKLFGSEELKKKYLPRCAAGEISAFALTEDEVGSDPARLTTTAELTPEGDAYILNGSKLWCTNGTLAKLLVVMARHPEERRISAFVVETAWPGVVVEHRCHFMGLRALANAVISFTDVRVPRENLIGEEGRGLKIALTTLNDGRLSIPNGSVGVGKTALSICRKWGSERVQWGRPIGLHEAITHKLADMAATTFAMESVARIATWMADQGDFDIRLEAAAAKEWNTARTWEIVDETMQIRGGRGYETETSLAARGEEPIGVERMMRDYRINKIFEGSSEIMHLFMAREAVDKHLEVAGALVDPEKGAAEKRSALLSSVGFYGSWYPTRWLGWGRWPRYREYEPFAGHLRFVERKGRKLSREIFHGMVVHQGRLQNKQAFLFRTVDIANYLFAMAASVARAHALARAQRPEAESAERLTELFCRNSRRQIESQFRALWSNDDSFKYRVGKGVVEGDHLWLEELLQDLYGDPGEAKGEAPEAPEAEGSLAPASDEDERRRLAASS